LPNKTRAWQQFRTITQWPDDKAVDLQVVNAFTMPERGTGSGPNNFGGGNYMAWATILMSRADFCQTVSGPIEVTAQQISAREPAENLLSYNGDYS
jgi:hypothetical protein